MAGYQVSKNLDLQLNANNIFDRTYYTAIGASSVWGSTDVYGNPRSYALTAKYSLNLEPRCYRACPTAAWLPERLRTAFHTKRLRHPACSFGRQLQCSESRWRLTQPRLSISSSSAAPNAPPMCGARSLQSRQA